MGKQLVNYHLWLRVECTFFCNLQSRAQTHAVLVIGLYELLLSHPGPFRCDLTYGWFGWVMVFNATFNNISVISWLSVLLVEETGVPRENHRPTASH
jgi:hypothetical protein